MRRLQSFGFTDRQTDRPERQGKKEREREKEARHQRRGAESGQVSRSCYLDQSANKNQKEELACSSVVWREDTSKYSISHEAVVEGGQDREERI